MPTENINTIFGLFRLIAFQKTIFFLNPPSINIILVRRKLMKILKKCVNSIKIGAKPESDPWFCVQTLLPQQSVITETISWKKVSTIARFFFTHPNTFFHDIFDLVLLNNISNAPKSGFFTTLTKNCVLEPFWNEFHLKSAPKTMHAARSTWFW